MRAWSKSPAVFRWWGLTAVLMACIGGAFADDATSRLAAQLDAREADQKLTEPLWRAWLARDYSELLRAAPKHAEAGSGTANYLLGELRLVDSDLDGGPHAAIAHFELAAAAGDPNAMRRLGVVFGRGIGVPRDLELARTWNLKWLQTMAATGNRFADRTKPVLFLHRPGEAPWHRFWTEWAGFYAARAKALQSAPITLDSIRDDSISTAPSAANRTDRVRSTSVLPADCRPGRPPIGAMWRAKVDQVDGALIVATDEGGQVAGMIVSSISYEPLRLETLELFSKALRASGCKFPKMLLEEVVIPFTFDVSGSAPKPREIEWPKSP